MEYLVVEHLTTKILKRVFKKISIDRETGCWNWTGALDPDYGMTWYKGRHEKVHRLLYAWLVEPLPMGHEGRKQGQLDHVVCKNTRCCNPLHVELVTQYVNTMRGTGPSAENARKTHCYKGHLLSDTPRGVRVCRTCDSQKHYDRIRGPERDKWLRLAREAQIRYKQRKRANGETIGNRAIA